MRMSRASWVFFFMVGCAAEGRPSYDPCTTDSECAGASDRCVEIEAGPSAVGALCTVQRCVGDSSCPLDARSGRGACLSFDGGLPTCFEQCAARADCAEGWSCESLSPVGRDPVRVCVPLASS